MDTKFVNLTKQKMLERVKRNLSKQVCLKKYRETYISLVKTIGQWNLGHQGLWITRDISKINFHFQPSTKNYYKVGTIYKTTNFSGPFSAFLVL